MLLLLLHVRCRDADRHLLFVCEPLLIVLAAVRFTTGPNLRRGVAAGIVGLLCRRRRRRFLVREDIGAPLLQLLAREPDGRCRRRGDLRLCNMNDVIDARLYIGSIR